MRWTSVAPGYRLMADDSNVESSVSLSSGRQQSLIAHTCWSGYQEERTASIVSSGISAMRQQSLNLMLQIHSYVLQVVTVGVDPVPYTT